MSAILSTDANPPEALTVTRTVVLAGNPNVGKSLFFNAYTGQYVNVSNFPGTTVDVPRGKLDEHTTLKDTPGVYGISNISEEETVAARTIEEADVIINVVSAISLERDLFLTQQIIDYGKPLIIALNQMDEAEARHLEVDVAALSEYLGVPVLPTVAVQREGLDAVKNALAQARLGNPTPDSPPPAELRLLEQNPGERIKLYGHRRHHVNQITGNVVKDRSNPGYDAQSLSQKVGQALLNPFIGMAGLVVVMLALYQIVGVWVAGDLVDLIEGKLFLGDEPELFVGVIPLIQQAVSRLLPSDGFLFAVLAGEFGVLTMSLQYIFGVLFPLVLGFYLYISILEDCGYLPRVAVLADGLLNKIGLNGRAVIPIILGFGCVTMATVSTRVLTSQRERTIASTILAITIPCSAQLAVIMALMASAGGLKAWALYTATLAIALIALGTILNRMLPGKSSALVLDLPPMRLPLARNVLKKSWIRTKYFLLEAAPLFMLGSLIVAVLQASGLLMVIQNWLAPVTQAVLHLPGETAQAFIMGMVRRDFGAAGLLMMQDSLSAIQIMTTLVVITLFVPCIASATVILKERGPRETTAVLLGSWVLAFAIGALVARLLEGLAIL